MASESLSLSCVKKKIFFGSLYSFLCGKYFVLRPWLSAVDVLQGFSEFILQITLHLF